MLTLTSTKVDQHWFWKTEDFFFCYIGHLAQTKWHVLTWLSAHWHRKNSTSMYMELHTKMGYTNLSIWEDSREKFLKKVLGGRPQEHVETAVLGAVPHKGQRFWVVFIINTHLLPIEKSVTKSSLMFQIHQHRGALSHVASIACYFMLPEWLFQGTNELFIRKKSLLEQSVSHIFSILWVTFK